MSADLYLAAKSLFLELRTLPPAERRLALESQPDDIAELVLELLRADTDTDAPLATNADGAPSGGLDLGALMEAATQERALPEFVGPYRILGLLGRGAMGVVFEAEQANPQRRVALKVVPAESSSQSVRRRFLRESAMLGRLKHPCIAQIYAADQADGSHGSTPYFAMELVDGPDLMTFADDRRLDLRDRIRLFRRVCSGVQHAHDHGILHRDLKPENVLVDSSGTPKILDFGIARMLDADLDEAFRTQAGQVLGTLAYMSPEQLSGDPVDIDARADVYALGAMLYELIGGELPIDVRGVPLAEAARRLSEHRIRPLAQVCPEARGDLTTIVHRALAREPEHRYPNADALDADLLRTLRSEPITARPASAWYRLAKFTERHRGLVVGVTLAAVTLLAGATISIVFALRATRSATDAIAAVDLADQRLRTAEREARKFGSIEKFLTGMLEQANPESVGIKPELARTVRVYDLLESASAEMRAAYREDPEVEAALRITLGRTFSGLRQYREAIRELTRAVELESERLHAEDPDLLALRVDLADARARNAEPQAAAQSLVDLVPRCDAATGVGSPLGIRARNALVTAHLAQLDWKSAQPLAERTLELARQHLEPDDEPRLVALELLANVLRDRGQFEQARPLFEELLERRNETLSPRHPDTLMATRELGKLAFAEGRVEEAEALSRTAFEGSLEVFGGEHWRTLDAQHQLISTMFRNGKYHQAAPLLEAGLEQVTATNGPDSPEAIAYRFQLARLRCYQSRFDEALEIDFEVIAWRRKNLGIEHPMTIENIFSAAQVLHSLRRFEAAEELYFEASQAAMEHVPELTARRYRYHIAYANCLIDVGQPEEAVAELEEAESLAADLGSLPLAEAAAVRRKLQRALDAGGASR